MVKNEKNALEKFFLLSQFSKKKEKKTTKRKKNKLFSIITKLTQDFFLKCAIFLRYKKDLADPV